MEGIFNAKYTTAYNSLKAVIEVERKETRTDKLPKKYFDRFEELSRLTLNLDERIKGFSLLIIEQYFLRNSTTLDKYIYMTYKDLESPAELKVSDLYEILENFFFEVYLLCVEIGNFYSIEIKLKKESDDNSESESDSMF